MSEVLTYIVDVIVLLAIDIAALIGFGIPLFFIMLAVRFIYFKIKG